MDEMWGAGCDRRGNGGATRRGRRGLRVLSAAAALVLLSACSGGEDDAEPGPDGGSAPAADGEGWTVLHYSVADTDLEPFMMADVEEMAEVGTQDGLNIVTLVDRSAEYTDQDVLNVPNWEGAKTLRVDAGELTEVEDHGDLNLGDPAVLADFIARGIAENPAEHYALVVSDHGGSWPGIGPDGSAGEDMLDLAEITTGISDGLEQAGLERFDLLGFDACLMASYEVASTLAPYGDRMLASSETEPGHGWDYRVLQMLADDPDTDVDTLGTALVDGYEAHAAEESQAQDITLSLVDLTQMAPLDEAVTEFSTALTERAATVAPMVGAGRASTLEFGKNPDPAQAINAADLGTLVTEIGAGALDVSDQADAVARALGDVVVHKIAGPLSASSSGLSIYFPPTAETYDPAYEEVPAGAGWAAFLASYYGSGEEIAPEAQAAFLAPDAAPDAFFDEDGLNLQAPFDPALEATLTEASIRYGIVQEDGSTLYLGEEEGIVTDDGTGIAQASYDLTTFEISDGTDTVTAYVDLTVDEESGLAKLDVPMAYYAPEDVDGETYQDVQLTIAFDPETSEVVSETYYVVDAENGTLGELDADPEGIITPELLTVSPDGSEVWSASSDVGLRAALEDLTYEFPPLEAGTELLAELTIVDFGGNTATATTTVAVP